MTDFEEMKLKDIIQIDLKNVVEKLILPNKDRLNYDKECQAWFIGGEEIVNELWYDCYTITHPKEIIGYIDEYIEEELKIPKGDTMNRAEALLIYKEIQTAQGEHNGRWRDELDHDDSAEEYLNTMKYWADKFEIEYDPDYKNYDDPEDCDESQLKDAMGYELKQILDKKLQDIILA